MKYAWIDEMDGRQLWWFSIVLACELLEVSRSGFYDWRSAACVRRPTASVTSSCWSRRSPWSTSPPSGRYGSPRIHAELVDQGWQIGVNRVARLMASTAWRAVPDAAGDTA